MRIISSIKNFFTELKNELRGLEVQDLYATIGYFVFILIIVSIVGLFVYLSDFILKMIIKFLLGLFL